MNYLAACQSNSLWVIVGLSQPCTYAISLRSSLKDIIPSAWIQLKWTNMQHELLPCNLHMLCSVEHVYIYIYIWHHMLLILGNQPLTEQCKIIRKQCESINIYVWKKQNSVMFAFFRDIQYMVNFVYIIMWLIEFCMCCAITHTTQSSLGARLYTADSHLHNSSVIWISVLVGLPKIILMIACNREVQWLVFSVNCFLVLQHVKRVSCNAMNDLNYVVCNYFV